MVRHRRLDPSSHLELYLVIDDDPTARDLIGDQLRSEGFSVAAYSRNEPKADQ